jgi:F-type H+-transporting ATPase subunit epsilon
MPATLKLDIVTPEGVTFSGDAEMVTLPASEGEMGVYPQHVPLMTQIVPGELVVRKDGHDIYLAVGDGFVEITNDHVAVLTDMAVPADQIDEAKAEEARRRAEARLAEHIGDEETAVVHATLANCMAQIAVKRKRRGHR